MEEYSREDLREFIEELQDHILKIEQDLLILEDNPGDVELLNECFRHTHSIKGACGYMGFMKVANFAHALENVFDAMGRGMLKAEPRIFDAVFKGMDLLKEFVESLESDGVRDGLEPDLVDQMIVELEALVSSKKQKELTGDSVVLHPATVTHRMPSQMMEDEWGAANEDKIDQELMEVFRDEMTNLLQRFEHLVREGQDALGVVEEIERLTNYVGHEKALGVVGELKSLINNTKDFNQLLQDRQFRNLYKEFIQLLPFEYTPTQENDIATDEENFDEDQELYNIFVDFVLEKIEPLRNIPSTLDEEWAIRCQEAIEAIKASATYMDYKEIVHLLEEWEERLTEVLTECAGKDDAYCKEPLLELWEGLVRLLPELEGPGVKDNNLKPTPNQVVGKVLEGESEEKSEVYQEGARVPELEQKELSAGVIIDSFTRFGPFDSSFAGNKKSSSVMESEGSVRISPERLESLVIDVGDLAVIRTGTIRIFDELRMLYSRWLERGALPPRQLKTLKEMVLRFGEHVARLDRISKGLLDQVLELRMVPVAHLFQRLTRVVRDLSRRLGKEVELEFEGKETTLDKQVMMAIQDPLMHIIRNAMDHGIEPAEERKAAGKPPKGRLFIQAYHEGNYVVIKVVDDGRGIDREQVIKRAKEKGVVDESDLDGTARERALELIFLPGMTTKDNVTETSGRGVGLDVVKKNIESLGGMIAVGSQPGKGSSFSIKIPLTLAIVPVLLMELGGQKIGIPMAAIEKTLRVYRDQISMAEGREIITVRQRPVPLIRLERLFEGLHSNGDSHRLLLAMVRHGEIEAAIHADAFLGQHDLVIKPLEEYLVEEEGFSGVATLADGSVALVLDVAAVLNRAGLWFKAFSNK